MKHLKNKLLVVVGPTTSHKTALSVKLANLFNGELINADAFQIYRDLDIGVNAPTLNEKKQATFHLNQFLELTDKWDIKKFKDLATLKIKEITKNNKLPILVGGSNLYVDAIIKNYQLSASSRVDKYDHLTNEELLKESNKFNPTVASKLVNNRKRLLRAVQIFHETNDPNALSHTNEVQYDYLMIECNYSTRDELYQSINNKVDEMFNFGWINEVKLLMKKYPHLDFATNNALKAIGYYDIYQSIRCNSVLDIELIKRKIRHFAKRQITWINNKYPEHIRYLQNNEDEIINAVKQWLNK